MEDVAAGVPAQTFRGLSRQPVMTTAGRELHDVINPEAEKVEDPVRAVGQPEHPRRQQTRIRCDDHCQHRVGVQATNAKLIAVSESLSARWASSMASTVGDRVSRWSRASRRCPPAAKGSAQVEARLPGAGSEART